MIIAWSMLTPTTRPKGPLAPTVAVPPLTVKFVLVTLVAVSVATVVAPASVGEALGAKMVVMSLLLTLSDGALRATGESSPLKP